MTIKYFSMFSGIGGFELGLQQSHTDFECIGFSEVDKYAQSIYTRHFPNHKPYGDATKINTQKLDDFQFLIGGFPCQAFSIAGFRKGFTDARGTLFFELARILQDKQPKYFLFENVKGLLSHECGRTFQRILEVLNELGYDVQWQVYNSCNYGVPQNRERIFLKGYSRSQCGREILSQRRANKENNGRLILLNNKAQAQMVYGIEGVSTSLCANGGGQGGKTGLYEVSLLDSTRNGDAFALCTRQRDNPVSKKLDNYVKEVPLKLKTNTEKGYDEAYPGDGVRLAHLTSNTARGRTQPKQCGTLSVSQDWGTIDKDYRIRRLTPTECERLQAFPDGWTEYGKDGEKISDTQRYKCLGNAVTTTVITAIANEMFPPKGEK